MIRKHICFNWFSLKKNIPSPIKYIWTQKVTFRYKWFKRHSSNHKDIFSKQLSYMVFGDLCWERKSTIHVISFKNGDMQINIMVVFRAFCNDFGKKINIVTKRAILFSNMFNLIALLLNYYITSWFLGYLWSS